LGWDALFQSPLPCFHALLEGFLRDHSELSHHSCFNGFRVLKTSSFDDFLEFGKQKEVTWGPDLESMVIALVQQCYFWQETLNSQGIMSWNIVMMKQP